MPMSIYKVVGKIISLSIYQGTFHSRMGTVKDRNGKYWIEVEEIKKMWQEYTEVYKKSLNDSEKHNIVVTYLELDILECDVSAP